MALQNSWFYLIALSISFPAFSQPLGSWQDHLPYHQVIKLSASNEKIIAATPYALFTVDLHDNTIERLSKINGLSEAGISSIATDTLNNKTVVAYWSNNIDILTTSGVVHAGKLNSNGISGYKNVSDISVYDGKAYVAGSAGITVIDLLKNEVKEAYTIGNGGNPVAVNQVAVNGSFLYAATNEGLKRAASTLNLSDYRNWQTISGIWSAGETESVAILNDAVILRKGDSIFISENTSWKLFYASSLHIFSIRVSSGRLVVNETSPGQNGRVVVLRVDGTVADVYQQAGEIISPVDGIMKQDQLWIADSVAGLIEYTSNGNKHFRPNAPFSIATGDMLVDDGSLWVTSGAALPDWSNTFASNGFYQLKEQTWKNYLPSTLPALDTLYDLVTVAVSKKDRSVWLGSLGGGLLRFMENENAKVFKQSALSPSLFHSGQYRVAGLAFDRDDNLWIANYGAAQSLVVRKADGSFRKFAPPFSLNGNALAAVVIDDFNQKWIQAPNGNGLLVFNHGSSIDNTGDDQWKFYRSGRGNGNLPDNEVLSIAKDKAGFIWVGTAKGIAIIQCPGQVFSGNTCEAILPVVQRDNFAGYLFSNEEVQTISVNAADQKWIGTKHGAWLISSDGERTIRHFTEENSPLPGNDVRKIAIDPRTGDVFFATGKGICSFRGDAIEGAASSQQLTIFPNPVPPGYNGSIAIRGLVNDAIIKITELDGRLVYQARATGGQAVWNGRDYRGRQVSSGVYLVMVSDNSRQEKASGKIVFISK